METFFVWHREGLTIAGEVIEAASDKDAALRHAEKAKVPLGRSITAIRDDSDDIRQFGVALEALADIAPPGPHPQ